MKKIYVKTMGFMGLITLIAGQAMAMEQTTPLTVPQPPQEIAAVASQTSVAQALPEIAKPETKQPETVVQPLATQAMQPELKKPEIASTMPAPETVQPKTIVESVTTESFVVPQIPAPPIPKESESIKKELPPLKEISVESYKAALKKIGDLADEINGVITNIK